LQGFRSKKEQKNCRRAITRQSIAEPTKRPLTKGLPMALRDKPLRNGRVEPRKILNCMSKTFVKKGTIVTGGLSLKNWPPRRVFRISVLPIHFRLRS
jgi:hypothetical protein